MVEVVYSRSGFDIPLDTWVILKNCHPNNSETRKVQNTIVTEDKLNN